MLFFDDLKTKMLFFLLAKKEMKVRAAKTCRSLCSDLTAPTSQTVEAAQDWIPVFPLYFDTLMII